jgi:asparagine synthase (glutamine-hydrolysing)
MASAIEHRGPDGEGFFVDDDARPSVGLANRRLAVIDVEDGDQPMFTEDGRHTVVYNGELFNASEVRRELQAAGHRFRTRCDTEVVLRGYAHWGEEVLDRLNGMWAFAVWDSELRRLFLARDRLGVKPLVYADTPEGLVFGSEIKALVASGFVDRELDPEALPQYLSFFAVPEPYSLVRGVRRLPAGHTLTVDPGGSRLRQYWDCAVAEEDDRGREAYREEVRELLEDSVRRRLVSDVPLGVLLSAGVDSNLVATFAARHLDLPLRTFTLGFASGAGDERPAARRLAAALGADHSESLVSPEPSKAPLAELLTAYDEPGQSLLQNHLVCGWAGQDVTVALSGLGGDELFGAYPTHVVTNLLARVDAVPSGLRQLLAGVARLSPSSRLRHAGELASMEGDARATRRLLHQTDVGLRNELLAPAVRSSLNLDAPAEHLQFHFDRSKSSHPLNRLLYVYLKTYLPDELLRSADAMSMLNSLELRTPFLDYRLVERAMAMPAHHKMRGSTGKLLLREIAASTPPIAVSSGKRGFSPPIGAWIRDELRESVRDVLAPPAVARRGLFDPKVVDRVVTEAIAGNERMVPPTMMAYCFELWAQAWLDGNSDAGRPEPAARVRLMAPREASTDVSVIIVNWNTRQLLHDCLSSIDEHLAAVDHEVIVVDNDSSDGSPDMVEEEFPHVRLIRNTENVGFGRANNQAMREARGEWLLLLNSDTVLLDGSVGELFESVRNTPDLGVAHCRLILPDGRLQHTAYRFPSVPLAVVEDLGLYKLLPSKIAGKLLLAGYWDYSEERDVDWVAGAFMLLPRHVFEETQGFDERLFMYGEDMEWAYRIRERGWRIRYYPTASIKHFDHSSSEIRWGDERIALCLRRQRDIYRERSGGPRTALLMLLHVAGAATRSVYYSIRQRGRGPKAEAYSEMLRHTRRSLRALVSLAFSRR